MRRPIPPIDQQAAVQANQGLLQRYPELRAPNGGMREVKSTGPKFNQYRGEWTELYKANGGKVEAVHPPQRAGQAQQAHAAAKAAPAAPANRAVTHCPYNAATPTGAPAVSRRTTRTCADGKTCSRLVAELKCSHGRKPNAGSGLLEVVPSEAGDTISLTGKPATTCGKPVKWSISGFLTAEKHGASTSFVAQRWVHRALSGVAWAANVAPHSFRVGAATECGLQTCDYTIRAYPGDKFALSINGKEWANMKSKIDYVVETILSAYLVNPQFEYLVGKGEVSAAWEEDRNSHLAFYAWKTSIGFDPLIGGKVRLPFGPGAGIPQWLKKYGDTYLFVEFAGGVSIVGEWGRTGPKSISGSIKSTGYIRGKIGGSMFLVSKSAISLEVAGSSGIAVEAAPDDDSFEKPAVVAEFKWEGLKAEITVVGCRGILEFKREFIVCDAQTIGKKKPFYVFG